VELLPKKRPAAGHVGWATALAVVAHAQAAHAAKSDAEPDPAGAVGSCAVSLIPADASDAWKESSRELELRLRAMRPAASDCSAVEVHVTENHAAVLVFTTRDGRQAVRKIGSPSDLVPVAEMLAVTVPSSVPGPVTPIAAASVEHAPQPPPALPASEGAHVLLGVRGGGRLSSPGGFASPSIAVSAAVAVGRWELGVAGQLDPATVLLGGGAPNGFQLSSFGVGASVGRREPVGPLALVAGGTLGVAIMNEAGATATAGPGATGEGQGTGEGASGSSRAEPRAGGYVGIVFPRRSSLRFRSELSGDVVASRIGRARIIDPALPALPWWSVTASIGAEWELP
jgi:hypothetical protein